MPTRRAINKKAARKFKVGDTVTWGRGVLSHRVIEVCKTGLIVDSSSEGPQFRRTFVSFDEILGHVDCPQNATYACSGPPRHAEKKSGG